MNIKVCFAASDGMEFSTVKDCILHEVKINPDKYKSFNNGIIIFDTDSSILNKGIDCTDDFFNAYSIVVFDKEKADSYFAHLVNEFEACVPSSDPGIYIIDGMEWRCRIDSIVGFADVLNQLYLKLI